MNLSDESAGAGAGAVSAFPTESFGILLAKEIQRSRRYYRGFGLLRVRAGSRPEPRADRERRRQAHLADVAGVGTEDVPPEWIEAIPRMLRSADVVARAPEGGLYVLLPETPASGVPAITRRLEDALGASQPPPAPGSSAPVIRHAAYPRDGETAGELLEALSQEPPPGS